MPKQSYQIMQNEEGFSERSLTISYARVSVPLILGFPLWPDVWDLPLLILRGFHGEWWRRFLAGVCEVCARAQMRQPALADDVKARICGGRVFSRCAGLFDVARANDPPSHQLSGWRRLARERVCFVCLRT